MSEQIRGLTVTFDRNIPEEAAEEIRKAILNFRHVVACGFVEDDFSNQINRERIKSEYRTYVLKFLKEISL